MERLTYKTTFGDYGSAKDFESDFAERCALRNKLGKYEDEEWSVLDESSELETETQYLIYIPETHSTIIDLGKTLQLLLECKDVRVGFRPLPKCPLELFEEE